MVTSGGCSLLVSVSAVLIQILGFVADANGGARNCVNVLNSRKKKLLLLVGNQRIVTTLDNLTQIDLE